ncbi:Pantothenate kinase type III, CoaX-like protein [Thioalkalivibrio nitratireducens DSM 14787]|uniref:Type III pantothenate kinase n=1 Tax=Thioalkalivibrio nitratireducens (strain DSM 14787 / UNIQEM 213 / ALEN2) TaxID=1255043 RepID=L0DXJ5_THIND|nr:Pantothenate kinase type III, CoaX-like protein [Thioalkalivibrio nitratireducens DSM 14787]
MLDLGSSRLKWQVRSDAGEILACGGSAWPGGTPRPELPSRAPDRIWMAHVGPGERAQALLAWVRQRFAAVPVQYVRPEPEGPAGLRLDYDHRQLGADRFCALLGVLARSGKPAVVIDAGTAITVDVLGAGGRHLGGYIAPGLRPGWAAVMRLLPGALREQIGAALPGPAQQHASAHVGAPGHGTAAALEQGWRLGLIGAVERLGAAAETAAGAGAQWWLTGGDAPWLAESLGRPVRVEPDLVLDGLWLYACRSGAGTGEPR